MTVFVYVNTSKQVGDPDHMRSSPPRTLRKPHPKENDPEGAAFEYEVLE